MNSETVIKSTLKMLSKDWEKRDKPHDAVRNQQLHFLENLDWYYVPPTEMFRRQPSLYSLFDSDGIPTHDADGNKLDEYTIQELHKEWKWQKKLFEELEKMARQYIPY
jgi:cysteinyl-tRNA synthetase